MQDGEAVDESDVRDRAAAVRAAAAADRATREEAARALADQRESVADKVETEILRALARHTDALEANAAARAENRARRDAHAERARSTSWTRPDNATGWDAAKRDFVDDHLESEADVGDALAAECERLADERERLLRALVEDAATHIAAALDGLASDGDRAAREAVAAQRVADAAERRAAEAARRAANSPNPLAEELLSVAQVLYQSNDTRRAMADIANAAARVIAGAESSSVSLRDGDQLTTVAASSPLADEHDRVQYAAGEGPCVQASTTGHLVASSDLLADQRWPRFAQDVATMTARSAVSAPITSSAGSTRGALNNYSTVVDGFDDDDADAARLLAAHLAVLVDWSGSVSEQRARSMDLVKAIETRDVIGQAKGILMERDRLTADQAFDVLRRVSQRLNRKLRDVAEELAMTGTIVHD